MASALSAAQAVYHGHCLMNLHSLQAAEAYYFVMGHCCRCRHDHQLGQAAVAAVPAVVPQAQACCDRRHDHHSWAPAAQLAEQVAQEVGWAPVYLPMVDLWLSLQPVCHSQWRATSPAMRLAGQTLARRFALAASSAMGSRCQLAP